MVGFHAGYEEADREYADGLAGRRPLRARLLVSTVRGAALPSPGFPGTGAGSIGFKETLSAQLDVSRIHLIRNPDLGCWRSPRRHCPVDGRAPSLL